MLTTRSLLSIPAPGLASSLDPSFSSLFLKNEAGRTLRSLFLNVVDTRKSSRCSGRLL